MSSDLIKYKNLESREIAYIAVFGALWGASEVSLGMLLHNMNIPFSGLLLTLIGSFIALTCVRLTNKKRAVFYTAFIAAVLKMLSFTAIKFGPIIGILVAAGVAQIVILLLNINLVSYVIAGSLMACAPFLQFLLGHSIIYSPKIFNVYQDFLNLLGLEKLGIVKIIIIIFLIHFALGSITGFSAWKFSSLLVKRINED